MAFNTASLFFSFFLVVNSIPFHAPPLCCSRSNLIFLHIMLPFDRQDSQGTFHVSASVKMASEEALHPCTSMESKSLQSLCFHAPSDSLPDNVFLCLWQGKIRENLYRILILAKRKGGKSHCN